MVATYYRIQQNPSQLPHFDTTSTFLILHQFQFFYNLPIFLIVFSALTLMIWHQ